MRVSRCGHVVLLLALVCPLTQRGAMAIETAGELFVDLDATTYTTGDAIWTNSGTYSDFQAVGTPLGGKIETTPVVFFDGLDDAFQGTDIAPAGLVGMEPTRSIEVWAMNPSIANEETLVAWGHRGAPDGINVSFNYGNHGQFGAAGRWGDAGPEMGWVDNNHAAGSPEAKQWHHLVYTYDHEKMRVYSDGELWNEKSTTPLAGGSDTYESTPIAIASQWNNDGTALERTLRGSVALGRVRIHDQVLTGTQILSNYHEEKDHFANPSPPKPPTPVPLTDPPIHRYSFSNPSSPDATDAVITDTIGSAHGIVLGNGSLFTGTELRLDGGSSETAAYVDLPNGLISNLTDVTVEGWITVQGKSSWQRLFDFGSIQGQELHGPGGSGPGLDSFMLTASRGSQISLQRLELRNIDPKYGGEDPGYVSDETQVMDTDIPTQLGEPYHFVVTYDSDADFGTPQLRQYRDGQLVRSQAVSIALGNINDVNNWLGRSNWPNQGNFAGTYDEFRIYEYALTGDEVLGNYQAGPDVIDASDAEAPLQAGDADQDHDFDQLDLVKVQLAAKFFTGQAATWGDGDWDGAPGGKPGEPPPGNGRFDQRDIIAALSSDLYMKGPYATIRPDVDLIYVPEPVAMILLVTGLVALAAVRRRAHAQVRRLHGQMSPPNA